jgi:hypothetical protein
MAPERGTTLPSRGSVLTTRLERSGRLVTWLPADRWLVPLGLVSHRCPSGAPPGSVLQLSGRDLLLTRAGAATHVTMEGEGVDLTMDGGADLAVARRQIGTLLGAPPLSPIPPSAVGPTDRLLDRRLALRRSELAAHITNRLPAGRAPVENLLGLGHGATPSGDDILVGMLAVVHRFEGSGLMGSDPMGLSARAVDRGQTTAVAAEMLYHATRGSFPEPLASFTRALGDPEHVPLVHRLADLYSLGSRSGRDMAHGALGLMASLCGVAEQQLLDDVDQGVHAHRLADHAGEGITR